MSENDTDDAENATDAEAEVSGTMDESPGENEITVRRERTITQTESLTVEAQNGSASDRVRTRKFVERQAELDLPDEVEGRLPDLISQSDEQIAVARTIQALEQGKEQMGDEEDEE